MAALFFVFAVVVVVAAGTVVFLCFYYFYFTAASFCVYIRRGSLQEWRGWMGTLTGGESCCAKSLPSLSDG